MGKQGPCYHCGVTSTPLWRNGPPEKPVLCNACGSRWRTKGTLANYTPLHARAEMDDFEEYRGPRVKTISIKNRDVKMLKRKQNVDNLILGTTPENNQGFRKILDEDTSNRSSSGSAISNSESCAQYGSADASDLTDPSQSVVWESMVPSKKRTCVTRPKPSSVEKLTKDLYTILHEQQSSCFSGSSEEDLLFESDTPMVSVEIGHGSVLIRHPSSIAREEESEASSLSVDNKLHSSEAYACSVTLPVHITKKGVGFASAGVEKMKYVGSSMQREQPKREKFQDLGNHNSVMCYVDLKDVVNFDEFVTHLTSEEQQQLLKYLPSVDTARTSDSLKSMFDSSQFKENLCSFQQLLAEGVFDVSCADVKTDDCKTLKKLALVNLTKSKWVEQYNQLKKCRNNSRKPVTDGRTGAIISSNSVNMKRPNDPRLKKFSEAKATMKSPKRMVAKHSCEIKEIVDSDGSCFSPSSLFAVPPDSGSLMLDSFNYGDGNSDQDLLLDLPSNGSFPQAELLHPSSSIGTASQASASSNSVYTTLVRP